MSGTINDYRVPDTAEELRRLACLFEAEGEKAEILNNTALHTGICWILRQYIGGSTKEDLEEAVRLNKMPGTGRSKRELARIVRSWVLQGSEDLAEEYMAE